MFKCGIRILINILQFTITKILGNSGACINSVYQAAFLSGLESRLVSLSLSTKFQDSYQA